MYVCIVLVYTAVHIVSRWSDDGNTVFILMRIFCNVLMSTCLYPCSVHYRFLFRLFVTMLMGSDSVAFWPCILVEGGGGKGLWYWKEAYVFVYVCCDYVHAANDSGRNRMCMSVCVCLIVQNSKRIFKQQQQQMTKKGTKMHENIIDKNTLSTKIGAYIWKLLLLTGL